MLERRCELHWGGLDRGSGALGPRLGGCGERSPAGEPAVRTPSPRRGRVTGAGCAGRTGAPGPGGLLVTYKAFQGSDGVTLRVLKITMAALWGMDRREERMALGGYSRPHESCVWSERPGQRALKAVS